MDASDSIVTYVFLYYDIAVIFYNFFFCSYVEFLVKNRKSLIHWQERAVVSVQQLHNEGNRIECAWLVLKVVNTLQIVFVSCLKPQFHIYTRLLPYHGHLLWTPW